MLGIILALLICIIGVLTLILLKTRKEEFDMAVVYATLIVKGLKNIEDVPAKIKKQVEDILTALEV